MILKAPYIVTMEGSVLKNHAILVEEESIQQIAPQMELKGNGDCIELPQIILLPGLINCHSHLELSQLPEPLPYPGSFVGWIDQLTRLKFQMSPAQIQSAVKTGIQKILEGGTTTIADHVSQTTPLQILMDSPLEGIAYVEVLGVERQRANYFYNQAMELQSAKCKVQSAKFKIVATPHATYSLLPEVFAKLLDEEGPLSIHIAESAEEYLLFKEKRGPLFEFLQMKGKTPATIGETPLQYLQRLKLLPYGCLAIHANYLEDGDITILNQAEASVVHCPGSHFYFEHERFPLGLLQDAEINIALGTDSLASNESLSMLRQMQIVLENFSELTPESVLKMATLNGANALRREKEIGSLKVGKLANIIGIPYRYPKQSIYENILLSEKVSFSMIRGERCRF